jgi:hypothetical protein
MALPRYYSKKVLQNIREQRARIQGKSNSLMMQFASYRFANELAGEYARHGFARRIQVLARCTKNVFKSIPAGTVRVPTRERLLDASINLQAFYTNAFGCIDNLAWIWVHERGLAGKIKRGDVGLRKNNWKVRTTFSPELQAFLSSRDDWFEYLAEFRHALGHRIPLYIPPGCVRPKDVDAYNDLQRRMGAAMAAIRPAEYDRLLEEQKKLHIFQPITTHSFKEATGTIRFHQQVLVDFLTVEELALKMLAELKSYQSSQKPPNSYSSGMGADDCKRPSK